MLKCEKVEDKYASAYIEIAIYLNEQHRMKDAIFYFEKALCFNPKVINSYL